MNTPTNPNHPTQDESGAESGVDRYWRLLRNHDQAGIATLWPQLSPADQATITAELNRRMREYRSRDSSRSPWLNRSN